MALRAALTDWHSTFGMPTFLPTTRSCGGIGKSIASLPCIASRMVCTAARLVLRGNSALCEV